MWPVLFCTEPPCSQQSWLSQCLPQTLHILQLSTAPTAPNTRDSFVISTIHLASSRTAGSTGELFGAITNVSCLKFPHAMFVMSPVETHL